MKSRLLLFFHFALITLLFVTCKKDPDPIVPSPCFSATPTNVDTAVAVSMDAGCSTQAVSYSWNFGDSTTASGQTVSHSWHFYGDKTITLTATSSDNTTVSTERTVKVDPRWRFAGTYNVTQSCGIWINPYVMTVTLSSGGLQISNFNGINWNVFSTTPVFENTTFVNVVTDALVDSNGKHWDVSGMATLSGSGNVLTFSYFVDNSAYYAAESVAYTQYSCNAVGTKQ